jgi:hypothetical protein
LVGANGMLADDAALDDGFWETAFLNQWMSRLGGGTDNIQRNSLAERCARPSAGATQRQGSAIQRIALSRSTGPAQMFGNSQ